MLRFILTCTVPVSGHMKPKTKPTGPPNVARFACSHIMIQRILLLLVITPILSFAQILNIKQEGAIKKTIAGQFGEPIASGMPLNFGNLNFQYTAKDTLFNPNGYYYVFKIKGDTLIRLDQSLFHGANSYRFLFTHNNTLYALGGYGHFITNNNLINFSFILKEWSFVNCTGETPSFILGPAYKFGPFIYSFNNYKAGNNICEDLIDEKAYSLNLITKEWKIVTSNLTDRHLNEKAGAYYTKDYLLIVYKLKTVIIACALNRFIELDNEALGIGFISKVKRIDQNKVFFEPFNGDDNNLVKIDIKKLWNENYSKSCLIEWRVPKKINFTSAILLFLSTAVIFIAALYFMCRYKKNNFPDSQFIQPNRDLDSVDNLSHEKNTGQFFEKNIVTKLIRSHKLELTLEEFDVLLEISHLTGDSRKLRRHRILKALPNGLVTRIKSKSDRRSFIYKINKEVIENNENSCDGL